METVNSEKAEKKQSAYDMVSTRIIKQLEQGTVPWQKPWANAGLPQNLVSGRPYKGVNIWLLSSLGYERNYFLTFDQINDLDARVKKGEKSHLVVYWQMREIEDNGTHEKVKRPFLKYYKVFNVAQCEGLPEDMIPIIPGQNSPIQACEDIVQNMPKRPEIHFDEHDAYYDQAEDFINMTNMDLFIDSESYYMTLFHELVHSTGHTSRLNRKELMDNKSFGSERYSMEELVAEIGACYLMSFAGIVMYDFKNSAAYIDGWLKKLKDDSRFIVNACALAQRAVELILNTNQEKKEKEEEKPELAEAGVGDKPAEKRKKKGK